MGRDTASAAFVKALREKEGAVARRKADPIQVAWQESALIYRDKKAPSEKPMTVLGDEHDLPGLVLRIHAAVIQLKVHPETSLFYPGKENRWGELCLGFQPTGLGRQILDLLAHDLRRIKQIYCDHCFHPYIEAFLTLSQDVASQCFGAKTNAPIHTTPDQIEALNGFLKALREKVTAAGFTAKVKDFRRSSNENHQRFRECADLISRGTYGSLAIERYDLGYSTSSIELSERAGVTYEQAKGHFDKFLNFMRKTTKDRRKGYVWKLQFTANRGYQFHLMLILDYRGHDANKLHQKLKAQWDQVISEVSIKADGLAARDDADTTAMPDSVQLAEASKHPSHAGTAGAGPEPRKSTAKTKRGSLVNAAHFSIKAYKSAAVGLHRFPMTVADRNRLNAELNKAAIYFTQVESFCKLKQGPKQRRAFGAGGIMGEKNTR